MTLNKLKTLALIGSTVLSITLALLRRNERRHREKQQHKQDLHTWEDEGGSLAPPASRQQQA